MQTRPATPMMGPLFTPEVQQDIKLLASIPVEGECRTEKEGELAIEGVIDWIERGDPRIYVAHQEMRPTKKKIIINDWTLNLPRHHEFKKLFWQICSELTKAGFKIYLPEKFAGANEIIITELTITSFALFDLALLDLQILPEKKLKRIATQQLNCTGEEIAAIGYFTLNNWFKRSERKGETKGFPFYKAEKLSQRLPFRMSYRGNQIVYLEDFEGVSREDFSVILEDFRERKIAFYGSRDDEKFPFQDEFLHLLQKEHSEMSFRPSRSAGLVIAPDRTPRLFDGVPTFICSSENKWEILWERANAPKIQIDDINRELDPSLEQVDDKDVTHVKISDNGSEEGKVFPYRDFLLTPDSSQIKSIDAYHVKVDLKNLPSYPLDSFKVTYAPQATSLSIDELLRFVAKFRPKHFEFNGPVFLRRSDNLDGLSPNHIENLESLSLDLRVVDCETSSQSFCWLIGLIVTCIDSYNLRRLNLGINFAENFPYNITEHVKLLINLRKDSLKKLKFLSLHIQGTSLPDFQRECPHAIIPPKHALSFR